MNLRPYQQAAVDAVYNHLRSKENNPCIVLPTGCHAKDHPILMYDGTIRKVQDVRVGDMIMGADSTPRRVLALAHGREPMARIVPVKGEPFVVNMGHIMSLVSTNEGKTYPCYQKGGEITNITVREYLTKSKSWRHLRKLYRVPVNFSKPQNLTIPPHILGMLIGDGTITGSIALTSADEELGDEFIAYAESLGCEIRITENDTGVPSYYATVSKGEHNPLLDMLYQMGLRGHCADSKFIPQNYLTASRSDRLQLLAGLIDSDGFYDGHCLDFITKSMELAGDIVFLCRSLGFMANSSKKYSSCQTGYGNWYYRIHISGDLSQIPCRRKRHVFNIRQQKKNILRTGFTVELLPEDNFYGFELDGDHLYVDGNFIVHHNTGKSLVLAQIAKDAVEKWNGRVLVLAHVKELLEQNADKIRKLCPELKIGIYSAGLKSRDTSEQVIVAGIQSVYNKACDLGAFDLIMVDECFPAGTLIDTPRGMIPIEELYVGQPVRHALGVGKIEAISSRPTKTLIELELNNGKTIRCTQNHLFFTENGWCKAGSMAVGTRLFSRENVSGLWKGVPSEYMVQCGWYTKKMYGRTGLGDEKILFGQMPVHETVQTKTEQTEQNSVETGGSDCKQKMSVLRCRDSSGILQRETGVSFRMGKKEILLNLLCQESRQSDVPTWDCKESIRCSEENRSLSEKARGKREGSYSATEDTGRKAECLGRIPCSDNTGTKGEWSTELLQNRCSNSINAPCISTGWELAFCKENERNGQKYETPFGGIRVVSIAYIKLESPCVVYNLQVEGHPSYYADGVLVHNCHLIAPDGDGMYRTFLEDAKIVNPHVRLIGLTATPFRLKGGLICKPENILNEICYEAGLKEMIAQGYLSPMVSRAGRAEAKLDDLHIRGGEFINEEISAAMDNEALVSSACREIIELTKDRKSVLIFASSIDHCKHISETIRALSGKECAIVTGETPANERAEILDRFKGNSVKADLFGTLKPPLKFLVNVSVLTTGFDAPNTDCIVLLRPTNSAGLLIQMVGRGTRLSPETGKSNCLVLDYGGNILRHGPVDMIRIKEPGTGKGGDAPAKKCPKCLALIHAAYSICPECGYEFPPPEKSNLSEHASNAGIISGQVDYTDYDVQDVYYAVHEKRYADPGTPKTMRIDYRVSFDDFKSEWVCPEHTGYARDKFVKWWKTRAAIGCPIPETAREAVALANQKLLAEPTGITVKTVAGEKFDRITGWRLKERPIMREPGDDSAEFAEENVHSNSPADLGVSPDDLDEIPF